ncbi:Putative ribonuclease H protein At1g65750 [Linum perenne]
MNLGRCTITLAELRGALEGIRQSWISSFRKVEMQIDSTAAVAIMLWRSLNFEICLSKDWEITIKHVYREANQAADFLANVGHNLPRGSYSIRVSDCNLAYYMRYNYMKISEPRLVNH